MGSIYIPTLNGWRAVAILLVLGDHGISMLLNAGPVGVFLAKIFEHGGIGVDVFFAISGYLICTLLLREKATTGEIDLRGFYIRRAFRILPVAYVFLVFVALLKFSIFPSITFGEILSAGFFIRNYVDGSWYTLHFWSLAVEEHFYFLAPIALLTLRPKPALWAILTAAALCAVARALEYHTTPVTTVLYHTECRMDGIMYGAALAVLLEDATIRQWISERLSPVVVIGIILTGLSLTVVIPFTPFRQTIYALVFPTLIAFTVLRPTGVLGRFLETPLLSWVGRLSFSLYIWQMIFLVPYVRNIPVIQYFPGALVGTALCAIASYYFLEKPCIRFGRRLKLLNRPPIMQVPAEAS